MSNPDPSSAARHANGWIGLVIRGAHVAAGGGVTVNHRIFTVDTVIYGAIAKPAA